MQKAAYKRANKEKAGGVAEKVRLELEALETQ